MANIPGTDDYQEQRGEDMLGAAAILGGASLLGTIYTQEKQSDEASWARKWQKQMSNTAHFRQMRDMRRAGLNPILSAGGSGASTPGGAMGNISPMQNPLNQGIQAAQGLASAKLTDQQASIAKVNADRKQEAYNLIEKSPGGDITNAMLSIAPNSKWAQGAAGIALGLGKASENPDKVRSSARGLWDVLKTITGRQRPDLSRVQRKRYDKAPSGYGSSKGGPKPKVHDKEQYRDFVVPYK